jgi:hypothetical protein
MILTSASREGVRRIGPGRLRVGNLARQPQRGHDGVEVPLRVHGLRRRLAFAGSGHVPLVCICHRNDLFS